MNHPPSRTPTTEIIIFIENFPPEPGVSDGYHGGGHYGSHIVLTRGHPLPLDAFTHTIAHELTHYYRFGPGWLNEGAAHFMEDYTDWKMGLHTMQHHRDEAERHREASCSRHEISNIRHDLFLNQISGRYLSSCGRALGRSFLHQAFDILGEEAVSSALRDLANLEEAKFNEHEVYLTFLANVPSGREDDFRNLYRHLHGGPYTDPDSTTSGDHGDSQQDATAISPGHVIEATLDYEFDFDYFSFNALRNHRYTFKVRHGSLRASNIHVLNSASQSALLLKHRGNTPSGPLLQWIAPSTNTFYLAVLSLRGETGPYSLDISVSDPPDVPDDHGDDQATATDLPANTTVRGVIDNPFDMDYFRIPLNEQGEYGVRITGGTLQCCVSYVNYRGILIWTDTQISWYSTNEGFAYLVVHGGHENTGNYVLEYYWP